LFKRRYELLMASVSAFARDGAFRDENFRIQTKCLNSDNGRHLAQPKKQD